MFFMTIDQAKFRKPARPGDVVEYHVDKVNHRRSMWWYRGEAKVGGTLIAEAVLGAYMSEE
jgi:3-hydroxyacyl-[acyl-carrier-protein] dehydratase